MKITGITQSKKSADRYYVSLENGMELRVNVALIADYSLYTGRDLTDSEFEALEKSAGQFAAKSRALKMINARALSKAELQEKLLQKGETEENAAMAAKLKLAFAQWFDNGHNDYADPNTILLRVRLTDGVLLSHGTRYALAF